jgi:biotin-(acetyl-CoA carboxylase) ligase
MGLNVGWAPDGAVALGSVADGGSVSPAQVLAAVLDAHDALPADVGQRYVDELRTIGRQVRVELPGDADDLVGRAEAVDELGRLVVVDASGTPHPLDVGDVVHVRPAHP